MTARELAYKILKGARASATYSNIAVDNALSKNQLSESDKGLLTAIVMGVTERQLTLDYIIDRLATRPDGIEDEARVLLQMGIYQVAFLDRIPEYAAVNETVDLAPKRCRGFVNAVLREFLRRQERGEIESLYPKKEDGEAKYLSVRYSFPEDFVERLIKIYGYERCERLLDIFNRPPKLTLRVNTLKISRGDYSERLSQVGIEHILSERLPDAIIIEKGSFACLPGFDEGLFFVQDEASQICVEALGATEGATVIDTCSCPGSKSFGSAIKMKNKGQIYSFDLHKSKLRLISDNAQRLGIDIISADVRDGREPDGTLFGKADRVLCDVPCSGLGVVAKKPEIRYKPLKSFSRLPEIQYSILKASADYVKEGGVLVYSTCTVLPEENAENFEKFLREHPNFAPCDFSVGELSSVGGMLSLSPDLDGTDGFFVAKCIRKEK